MPVPVLPVVKDSSDIFPFPSSLNDSSNLTDTLVLAGCILAPDCPRTRADLVILNGDDLIDNDL